MANRQLTDERGMSWDVWDVYPSDARATGLYDRRSSANVTPMPPDRGHPLLDAELEHGWLCFQAGLERRRFAPIPTGWEELPDGVLRVMLSVARRVTHDSALRPRTPAAE